MFLSKFFKPKWQSRNSQVRREGFQGLDLSDPASITILREAAQTDADPVNRQTALGRLSDADLLVRLSQSDNDATVRAHAVQRISELIGDAGPQGAPAAQRRGWLESSVDKRVQENVARNGNDPHMRLLAAQLLGKESLFCDMAVYDDDSDVRIAAAAQITNRNALEKVLRHARTRDKRVRAEIQSRLDELAAESDRPARVRRETREICQQLEALPDIWKVGQRLDDVTDQCRRCQERWAVAIEERVGVDEENWAAWDERYQLAFNAVEQLISEAQVVEAPPMVEDHSSTAELLTQLTAALTVASAPLDDIERRLGEGQVALNQFRAISELQPQIEALESQVETVRNAVAVFQEEQNKIDALQQESLDLLAVDGDLDVDATTTFNRSLKSLAKPYQISQWLASYNALQDCVQQLTLRLDEEKARRNDGTKHIADNVTTLTALLKEGKSLDAAKLAKQLQVMVDELQDADRKGLKSKGVLGRLQRAQGKLRELKDWQEWASTPVREQLSQEMETFEAEIVAHADHPNYDFATAARRIREARRRWRGLGPAEPGTSETLWERFNGACNRAYEPCQARFDRDAQERDEHLQQRSILCAQLETFFQDHIDGKDSTTVDWRGAEKFLRDQENAWRKAGPVDRKTFQTVHERFRTAVGRLRDAFAAERDDNHAKKAALVKRANKIAVGLQDGSDDGEVRSAAEQMKHLFDEWRKLGHASQEKALWQEFCAARDIVSGAQQAQFDFATSERHRVREKRIGLCEAMEALSQDGLASQQMRAKLDALKVEWETLDSDKEKAVRSLDRRFNAAMREVEKRREQEHATIRFTEREHLRERGEICDALESLTDALQAGTIDHADVQRRIDDLEQRWNAADTVRSELTRGVNKRFTQVLSTLRDNAAALENEHVRLNTERKAKLAVRWEILANIESPPHARESRMAIQVAQLAEKMTTGGATRASGDRAEEERIDLLAEWCATGPIAGDSAQELNERFSRAYASLYQQGQPQGH